MKKKPLELLSPAQNAETAIEAIKHGADAVYMGGPSHGARKTASNTLDDIARVVDFAHQYRAKVYVTVNTIIYENEIKKVEELCRDLYHIAADALIVQDMSLLRMNLPPIALHASTQCDIRTPEKALFLQEVGFSQLVLARELTLSEIKEITETVKIPVESFIHGALCVSYSGRCHASLALTGRSANRGECAQICRLPFTLKDSEGKILSSDKYLLSLKDLNLSHDLPSLIDAGVSSFKIEGRLKDSGYVKNITAFYNDRLNEIIDNNKEEFCRSSYGKVTVNFDPNPEKSFNRSFTKYFLTERKPPLIASLLTPKSQGENIKDISRLNNGDGISFYNRKGEFTGININKVENGRIIPARKVDIPTNAEIYRTSDIEWNKKINKETSVRKIGISVSLDNNNASAEDEIGNRVILPINLVSEKNEKEFDYAPIFRKLGSTNYYLKSFDSNIDRHISFKLSDLTSLRRKLTEELSKANLITYPFSYRRKENLEIRYPDEKLIFSDNVSNSLAARFYEEHGVRKIEQAAEVNGIKGKKDITLMTTRHCILRELGLCKKESNPIKKQGSFKEPLFINHSNHRFKLSFDCNLCEMKVIST